MVDVMYGCGSDYDNSEEELPEVELKAAHDRIIAVTTGKAIDLMTELASSPLFEDSEEFDDLEVRFDSSPLFDPYIISSSKPLSSTTGGLVKDSNNNNTTSFHSAPMDSFTSTTTRSRSQSNPFNQNRVTFVTSNKRTIHRTSATTKKSRTASRTNRKTNLFRETEEYYTPEFILKEGLKKRKGSVHHMHKPYVCPVPGCGKYYKNPNGIKYHAKYGHSAPQEFPCHCGKMYSTRHGLMAHKKIHGPSGWPLFESKNNWKQINKV